MNTLVLAAQKYLNATYKGRAGYTAVTEDGLTAWPTVHAITRALQLEMGITKTSDAFGPATTAAFGSKLGGKITSASPKRVIALLQCALWCKGYQGGGSGMGVWDHFTTVGVTGLRADMGLSSTSALVSVKIMKSLCNMDAFSLLSGGTTAIQSGQRWLNASYSSRADFDLAPCDGLFTRNLQTAILYAIQYELGMADGVANGVFGPGTQAGLKSSAVIGSGSKDGSHHFVRLFQLLLACNKQQVSLTGAFDAATVKATTAFQSFLEITTSGKGDFGTWAALLVSTGDPNRPVTGFDCSTPLTTATATARYKDGYRIAGRYLTVTGKAIGPGELPALFAAGLKLAPIFQNYNNTADDFSTAIGVDHGFQAVTRARELGLPAGATIFFAVDYDAPSDEASDVVEKYFDGVATGVGYSLDAAYKIGVYATRNVCSILTAAGKVTATWVSGMSTGYSGNLGFTMPTTWSYNQIYEDKTLGIDHDAVSPRATPTTTNLPTPLLNGAFNPLYWGNKTPIGAQTTAHGLMELQLLAEKALKTKRGGLLHLIQAPASPSLASQLVMQWFQKDNYSFKSSSGTLNWLVYTPPIEAPYAAGSSISDMSIYSNLVDAINEFETAAGEVTQLDFYNSGYRLDHAVATAHGVYLHGTAALSPTADYPDLGGWALDLAQLWGDYLAAGRTGTITSWVNSRLGGTLGRFSYEDLVGDAQGWLIGSLMNTKNVTFGEAWRQVLNSTPTPKSAITAFVHGRFGKTPTTTIASAAKDLFGTKNSEFMAALLIMKTLTAYPKGADLNELSTAVATRLTALASL